MIDLTGDQVRGRLCYANRRSISLVMAVLVTAIHVISGRDGWGGDRA